MRGMVIGLFLVLGGCRTVRGLEVSFDCSEVDAARRRTIDEQHHARLVTLSRDQLLLMTCGTVDDREAIQAPLRNEGRLPKSRIEEWTLKDLRSKLPTDAYGIAAEAAATEIAIWRRGLEASRASPVLRRRRL